MNCLVAAVQTSTHNLCFGAKIRIRAVAGQRSSPDLCFATKSIKSMTKDIDLNVTQVGRDGTA